MAKLPLLAAAGAALSLSACATPFPYGSFYTEVALPVGAGSATSAPRVGKACAQSFLSLVATGDASVATAKKEGNITNVASIDMEVNNILGFIGEYCTVVRGN